MLNNLSREIGQIKKVEIKILEELQKKEEILRRNNGKCCQ